MKRSPLARKSRLRPMSRKRKAALPTRAKVRVGVLERDGYRCRAAHLVPDIACWGVLDVHEVAPRSVNPGAWLDPDACIAICRTHHDWVGDNPLAARELGLHRFSWDAA